MFHPIFKRKFEYFTNYFEAALKNQKHSFPQSLVLYGQDIFAQYYLAMEISRQLNCLKGGDYNCDCLNCNWIRNNQHPAMMTISKNDNKPSDDTSTKVISIKQTLMINNSLINSSDYYRVFIFCDSQISKLSQSFEKNIKDFCELRFKFPQEDWLPLPLNREVLIEASANSLLKSIEEPPERTLFIFLTEDKEDIIETIISRSQCFYIPSFNKENYETEYINFVFEQYPCMKKTDIINIAESLLNTMQENDLKTEYVLDCMEFYLVDMIKRNLDNKLLVQKIKKDILKIQHAKKQANAYIKPQLIIENLLFSFCV